MPQPCAPVLRSLVRQIALTTKPLNAQDAILLLRSLNSLRVPSEHTRRVCEKAAITLASVPKHTVPVDVMVDAIHSLVSLQTAPSPIVDSVLVKRLLELGPVKQKGPDSSSRLQRNPPPRPQTLQKAALCLMKMGKRRASAEVCDAVIHRLHLAIQEHPEDRVLQLSYIGLYPYTSLLAQPGLRSRNATGIRDSLQSLLKCAQSVVAPPGGDAPTSLRGNAAWQAMHLYVALAFVEAASASVDVRAESTQSAGRFLREWSTMRRAFVGTVDPRSFSFSRLADFIADFGASLGELLLPVLHPLQESNALSRSTRFDVSKVCTTLGTILNSSTVGGEGKRVASREVQLQFLSTLMSSVSFAKKLEVDGMTVAALWHLYAALSVSAEGRAPRQEEGLEEDLCAVSQRVLTSSRVTTTPSSLSEVAWVVTSVARVATPTTPTRHHQQLQQLLVSLLAVLSHSSSLDSLPLRSLAQLWYSASVLEENEDEETMPRFPRSLVKDVADAICAAENRQWDAADAGMLLAGCKRLANGCERVGGEALTGLVVAVAQRVMLDDSIPAHAFAKQPPHTLDTCLRLLEKHNVDLSRVSLDLRCLAEGGTSEGSQASMTPEEALRLLLSTGGRSRPPMAVLESVCKQSQVWAQGLQPSDCGSTILKCAEICQRGGCSLVFAAPVKGSPIGGRVCVVPVDQLLAASPRVFTRTDAAHVVRLMGDVLSRTGSVPGASANTVAALISFALSQPPDSASVPLTLFLLHANKELSVSNKLFTKQHLAQLSFMTEAIMAHLASSATAAGAPPASTELGGAGAHQGPILQLVRVVRAFLNSQVLFRLGEHAVKDPEAFKDSLRLVRAHVEGQQPPDKGLLVKMQFLFED